MAMTIREADKRIEAALRAAGHPGLARGFGPYDAKREADALALRQQAIEALAEDMKALRAFVREVWDLAFTESRPPKTMDDLRDYLKRTMEADDFLIFDVCGVCDGEAVISKDPARRDDPDAPTIPCSACVRGRFPL